MDDILSNIANGYFGQNELRSMPPQRQGSWAVPKKHPAGFRPDGNRKGDGWLGSKAVPGGYSTEISVGVNIGGKEVLIPLIIPTTTDEEIKIMAAAKSPQEIPEDLVKKAVEHAVQRIKQGESPFYD